jgi:hypothetical protein
MKPRRFKARWSGQPHAESYSAAANYLKLVFGQDFAREAIKKLRKSRLETFEAKDILRACGDPPQVTHIEEDCREILDGVKQSPLLLVRNMSTGRVVVADGFHRLCAVFKLDSKAAVPCKLA